MMDSAGLGVVYVDDLPGMDLIGESERFKVVSLQDIDGVFHVDLDSLVRE